MPELKIDLSADASERLAKEIEFSNVKSAKQIGEFLLEQFKKDEPLKEAYRTNKITLDELYAYVVKQASALQANGCAMVESDTVFGWAIHFVQDGCKEPTSLRPNLELDQITLTKEDEETIREKVRKRFEEEEYQRLQDEQFDREKAEKEKRAKAIEKEKKEREESGQMSIFDFMGEEDETQQY